jgi:hypothetical protein
LLKRMDGGSPISRPKLPTGKGRHTAEAVMGPLLVVFAQPGVGHFAHLLDGFEDVRIENLMAVGLLKRSMKAF